MNTNFVARELLACAKLVAGNRDYDAALGRAESALKDAVLAILDAEKIALDIGSDVIRLLENFKNKLVDRQRALKTIRRTPLQ